MCDLLGNNQAPRLSFLFPLGLMMGFVPLVSFFPSGLSFETVFSFYWFIGLTPPDALPLLLSFGSVDSLNLPVFGNSDQRLLFILLLHAFSPRHDQILNANALCVLKFSGYYMFDFPVETDE